MKKLFVFTILIPILIVSCTTYQEKNTELTNKTVEPQLKQHGGGGLSGREINQYREESINYLLADKDSIVENTKLAGVPIIITEYKTSSPNSANGVDCSIKFFNISNKRLKYAYFTVIPYNTVDDITYSTINNKSEAELQYTGFVEQYKLINGKWEAVWYNSTIKYMDIIKVRIIFDDNSEINIVNENDMNKMINTDFDEPYVRYYGQEKSALRLHSLYFLIYNWNGFSYQKVEHYLPSSRTPLLDTLNYLIAGPIKSEIGNQLSSYIPPSTRVLSARINGSTAIIDFNKEFLYNTHGSTGYELQLGQIVYTATEFPIIKEVQILIEGKKIEYLSGRPLTRENFK